MKRQSLFSRLVLIVGIAAVLCADNAAAQIEVSPTRVLLSMRNRSQEVNIHNSTDQPVEVTTDLGFKLIESDSLGNVSLRDARDAGEHARSCRDWIKIFPHRFMLEPGSSRSVRILILPPDSIPDGEFWGRVIFGSTVASPVVPVMDDTISGIRSSLAMRLYLDIPIIFRKGKVETGISLDDISVLRQGGGMLLLLDLGRLGNSAYRGTIRATIRDAGGGELGNGEEQFTAEFSVRRSVWLPAPVAGTYTLQIDLESFKKGGANDAVIPASTVSRTFDLQVSSTNIQISPRE